MFYDRQRDKVMSKKTLALISALVLVTVVLFVIALKSSQNATQNPVTPSGTVMKPSPTVSVAHSVLSLLPNPVRVIPGGLGTASVEINTSDNPVTAVQLEISYDPKVLSNVKVVPGPLFQNPVVLINKDNPVTGKYTYAFGRTPAQTPVQGTGVVATITFSANASIQPSQLTLLPTTLVTARGVATSVLKSSSGTVVVVGSGTGAAIPPQQSSNSAGQ